MARNAVDVTSGGLRRCRYVLHDRDAKFCTAFDELLASEGVLNVFAERWVRSARQECLSKLILFGERPLHGP
jgi:hypothetical protein